MLVSRVKNTIRFSRCQLDALHKCLWFIFKKHVAGCNFFSRGNRKFISSLPLICMKIWPAYNCQEAELYAEAQWWIYVSTVDTFWVDYVGKTCFVDRRREMLHTSKMPYKTQKLTGIWFQSAKQYLFSFYIAMNRIEILWTKEFAWNTVSGFDGLTPTNRVNIVLSMILKDL